QLAEEDPMLRIVWNSKLQEIQAQLMGDVQIEVLKQIIEDRFGMTVSIDTGSIMYKETIDEAVEGVGHFEPLRHYAEVHLLMEPLPRGTGIIYESACAVDDLDLNWQRLILTNLAEKEHIGVLTGAPITDMKITVVAGRAHLKHTEGGDFRQATYRAVRQGLMQAKNVLLEPWYDFRLEVPADCIGRAISDIKAMHAEFEGPADAMDALLLTGTAPVSEMQDYQRELLSYTKGKGRLACRFAGYYPCHNTAKVIEEKGYIAERDVENIADSVFCSHGAGVNVKWDCVREFMHIDSGLRFSGGVIEEAAAPKVRSRNLDFDEKELEAIMLKEFGPIKRPQYTSISWGERKKQEERRRELKKDYLIVDGYNIIYGWEELKKAAKDNFAGARSKLCDMLENYHGYKGGELVLVFDGYKVKDNPGTKDSGSGLRVVYTKEGESADGYIERLCREIGKNYNVRVATSDGLIQLTALRAGVMRMSARELETEVRGVLAEISDLLAKQNTGNKKLGDLVDLSQFKTD
ncbi:MAG: NYN domain-containing protein, partial [Clostridia bacterium]|nr:NYN domain-containing protein [Clostridia bacterium]